MLSDNDKQVIANYEKRLQKPKWQFIIVNGFIWAFLVLIIMILQQYFVRGRSLKEQWNQGLPISLIFLIVAGLIYGWLIRLIIKRKYDQLKEKAAN
jgi:uncharacterized integral membrane protein